MKPSAKKQASKNTVAYRCVLLFNEVEQGCFFDFLGFNSHACDLCF